MKHINCHGKTKIGKDPTWIIDDLKKRGWELRDISLIYTRILACAENGESAEDVMRRLNPVKRPVVQLEPSPLHGPAGQAFPEYARR